MLASVNISNQCRFSGHGAFSSVLPEGLELTLSAPTPLSTESLCSSVLQRTCISATVYMSNLCWVVTSLLLLLTSLLLLWGLESPGDNTLILPLLPTPLADSQICATNFHSRPISTSPSKTMSPIQRVQTQFKLSPKM